MLKIPRGRNPRTIRCDPTHTYFKPRGIPLSEITEEVLITLEELETLRLTSLEGLSQGEAGTLMEVSQSTISRHLDDIHRKLAKALVHGLAIRIENTTELFHCDECGYSWNLTTGNVKVSTCENCGSNKFHTHTQR
ncbi:MAG: DUF134 domain-containing protein [Candidatus Hodarchaeales archaeon]